MRPSHKVLLITAIAAELQKRYTFADIDMYLQECGLETPHNYGDSKLVYVKHTLAGIDNKILTKIVDDLELDIT